MKDNDAFDRHWHLATTDHEIALTELEFSLFRSFEAFHRWQAEGMGNGYRACDERHR